MSRGLGALEPIQELVPDWFAIVVALLTQLGDVWFLAVLLAGFYWLETPSRDDVAALAGLWLSGLGLYQGLKVVFALPRPGQPLLEAGAVPWLLRPVYEATAFATGYGFPSGHAVNSTIVYVGLAVVLPYGSRRQRFGGAAAVVATVSLSRIALGVHFLVDVVAGVAVGSAVLLAGGLLADRLPADRPTVAFGFAIAFAASFVVASGAHWEAQVLSAATLGAFAGWQLIVLERRLEASERPSRGDRSIRTRAVAAATAVVPLVAALVVVPIAPAHAASGAIGLVSAAVVASPIARRPDPGRRIRTTLRRAAELAAHGLRERIRLRK